MKQPPLPPLSPDGTYRLTSITQGKKDQNRVNICLNGRFAFTLDIAQLVDFKLKVGSILTPEEYDYYKQASNFGKLYQATLNWLMLRPRSVKEARDYLFRKKIQHKDYHITDDDINLVIDKLSAKNYLNDANFAEYFVENRSQSKGISSLKLRLELMKKGIAQDLIEEAMKSAPRDDSEEIAKIIFKKHRLKTYQDRTKLIQYLVRQGFDYELAKTAVADFDSEMDSQNSEQTPPSPPLF
ncbi:RecX family transcriptional regulator [Candidatus Saccharibacteria bacterium]|nr:RecX family transcriptional regulator [Candidatus Saccharibacteria bacterium]